jgi:hypothetical protein
LQIVALQALSQFHPEALVPTEVAEQATDDADSDPVSIQTYRPLDLHDVKFMLQRCNENWSIAEELVRADSLLQKSLKFSYTLVPRSTLVNWRKVTPHFELRHLRNCQTLPQQERQALAFSLLLDASHFVTNSQEAGLVLDECLQQAQFPVPSLVGAALGQQRWNHFWDQLLDGVVSKLGVSSGVDLLSSPRLSEQAKLHLLYYLTTRDHFPDTKSVIVWVVQELDPSCNLYLNIPPVSIPGVKRYGPVICIKVSFALTRLDCRRQALRHLLSFILYKLLNETLTASELLAVSHACSPEVERGINPSRLISIALLFQTEPLVKLCVIEAVALRCGEEFAERSRLGSGIELDEHDGHLLHTGRANCPTHFCYPNIPGYRVETLCWNDPRGHRDGPSATTAHTSVYFNTPGTSFPPGSLWNQSQWSG